ncbi:MAG: MFS transporter, partial [Lachnospiraceae bacterium]|nr:MFS transporter [Lachnospiraceae bacterium]
AEYICYGLGDFSFCFIYGAIGSYMVFFYTDIAKISAATVGTILLLSKIFDGISDLLMGYIIEHVHSPLGKARPWLLWMSIPYCIGAILLFTVPDFSYTGRVVYAFISYNLMATFIYTSMNVPYGVLSSVMTNKQNERAILSISRAAMGALGVFLISSYAPDIVDVLGGGAAGWQRAFIIIGILSVILFFITFFGTKERVGSGVMEQKTGKKQSIGMLQGLKILAQNKYWFIMLLVNVFYTAMTSLYVMNMYYAKYVIADSSYNKRMMMCSTFAAIFVPLLIIPIVQKIGKRNVALYGGAITGILGQILVILLTDRSLAGMFLGLIVRGIGVACISATKFGMIADSIEYGEFKTGVRAEGFVYSAASLGVRVGSAVAAAVIGWILGAYGYNGALEVQSATAIHGIRMMFFYAPLVVFLVLLVLLLFYHLDKEYDGIMIELEKRHLEAEN